MLYNFKMLYMYIMLYIYIYIYSRYKYHKHSYGPIVPGPQAPPQGIDSFAPSDPAPARVWHRWAHGGRVQRDLIGIYSD